MASSVQAAGDLVVDLSDVTIIRQGRTIMDSISWQVKRGERWALLGPNGSGKTTLLTVAGMRMLPTAGRVTVLGETFGRTDARALRRRISFVSGSLLRVLRPSMSLHEVVMTGANDALETCWHKYSETDQGRASQLLAESGLAPLSDSQLGLLSEGERQLGLLARALMGNPELLLLDEPAAGLDLGHREALVSRLAALAGDPLTAPMVLVTHHTEEVPPGVTHALLLREGRSVASGPVEEVLDSEHLSECFDVEVEVANMGGRYFARAKG